MPDRHERLEIMQACSRKLALSSLVDLEEYASDELTAGFTGADLQALVYNAHLDALHASIADDEARTTDQGAGEEVKVEYTSFGGKETGKKVLSLAEKGALDRRVSGAPALRVSRDVDDIHSCKRSWRAQRLKRRSLRRRRRGQRCVRASLSAAIVVNKAYRPISNRATCVVRSKRLDLQYRRPKLPGSVACESLQDTIELPR